MEEPDFGMGVLEAVEDLVALVEGEDFQVEAEVDSAVAGHLRGGNL